MKNVKAAEAHPLQMGHQGFTLVELAIAVAIMGLLVAIAIPQYRRYLARGRQAEAKMALGAAFVAETNFRLLNISYTGCLGDIGVAGTGPTQYYAIGIPMDGLADMPNCSSPGGLSCLAFAWNVPVNVVTSSCTAGPFTNGSTHSYEPIFANVTANPSSLPLSTVNGTAITATASGVCGTNFGVCEAQFKILAFGSISASSTIMDEWSIDYTKTLINIQLGI